MTTSPLVGRASHILVDRDRENRTLGVEVWYPLASPGGEPMMYELLPGVGFFGSSVAGGTPVSAPLPVVIVSHGHMGTRLVYSQLCEALAQRGFAVVSLDHPGDTMADVLLGSGVDEATNIEMRVTDLTFLVRSLGGDVAGFDHGLTLDMTRLSAVGHSFGGYAVVEWASRPAGADVVTSLVALQPYLLPMSPSALSRVRVPLMIVAGANDQTTPIATNVLPALEHLPEALTTAYVLDGVGHQGCSDVALYIETAPSIDGVPDFVVDFLSTMTADTTGVAGEPWRPVTEAHIELVSTWLKEPTFTSTLDATAQRHRGRRLAR